MIQSEGSIKSMPNKYGYAMKSEKHKYGWFFKRMSVTTGLMWYVFYVTIYNKWKIIM